MEIKLNKIKEIGFYALAFSVPLPLDVSKFVLILWFLVFIIGAKKNLQFGRRLIPAIVILAIYVLLLISAFYSEEPGLVFKRIFGPALPLFIFAICSVINAESFDFSKVLKCFVLGNFVNIIFLFMFLFWSLFYENKVELYVDFSRFTTEILSYFTHRTYSGFNIVIAIISIVYLFRKNLIEREDYFFYLTFVAMSLFFIVFNNSRVMSLSLILIFSSFLLTQNYSKKRFLAAAIFLLMVIGSLFFTNNRFSSSLKEIVTSEKSFEDPRTDIWAGMLEVIKESPYIGLGCANYEKTLFEKYGDINCLYCRVYELGPHNQFLELWAEIGFVGPLFLIVFFISLWYVVKNKEKRLFFGLSSVVMLLFFIFESAIYRYSGSLSVGFLLFLLSNHTFDEDKSRLGIRRMRVVNFCLIFLSLVSVLGMFFCLREVKKETVVLGRFKEAGKVWEKLPIDCSDKIVAAVVDKNVNNKYCYAYEGNSYFYRRVAFSNNCKQKESKVFSVDCYVSDDFEGEWVRINTETYNRNGIKEDVNCYYDMGNKGIWQNLKFEIPEGRQVLFLYVKRQNSESFRGMDGFVVYANPKIE